MMKSMLSGEKVPVPSGVFEAYAEAVAPYAQPAEDRAPAAEVR
jgi:hypothetical protein